MADAFQMVTFSKMFGWTPNQIREIDVEDRLIYFSIMKGMGEAESSKGETSSAGMPTPQMLQRGMM